MPTGWEPYADEVNAVLTMRFVMPDTDPKGWRISLISQLFEGNDRIRPLLGGDEAGGSALFYDGYVR